MCQVYKSELHCKEDMFSCRDASEEYNKCIPLRWICDGRADCPNSFDEHPQICSKGKAKYFDINLLFCSNIFQRGRSFNLKSNPLKPIFMNVDNSDI